MEGGGVGGMGMGMGMGGGGEEGRDQAEEIELGEEEDDLFAGVLREPGDGGGEIGGCVLDAAVGGGDVGCGREGE